MRVIEIGQTTFIANEASKHLRNSLQSCAAGDHSGNRNLEFEALDLKTKAAAFLTQRSGAFEMKIVLMTCLATAALSTAALADSKMDVKPAAATAMMGEGGAGAAMAMKPAATGSANATSSKTSGSMMSAWKTGGNSYGFAGNTGGCHLSGTGGAGGFKNNGGC
jgi:hypothetical protein